jgi:hypothetical protein
VRQDERARFVSALEQAGLGAYSPGEYAGQESFMRAGEGRDLARRAGIGPEVSATCVVEWPTRAGRSPRSSAVITRAWTIQRARRPS